MLDFMLVILEIILVFGVMVLLMIGVFGGKKVNYLVFVFVMSFLGVVFLVFLVMLNYGEMFGGFFVLD